MKKLMKLVFYCSMPIFIIGYFLQTILIPLQDIDTITPTELKEIQLELAINYPLGITLMRLGFILLLFSSFFLLFIFVKLKISKITNQ